MHRKLYTVHIFLIFLDLDEFQKDIRIGFKNGESVIGTDKDDIIIGANTVYDWEPPPPPPPGQPPVTPPPEPQWKPDEDFQGYELDGGEGNDTILIYDGDDNQHLYSSIKGGKGDDIIVARARGNAYKIGDDIVRGVIDGGVRGNNTTPDQAVMNSPDRGVGPWAEWVV